MLNLRVRPVLARVVDPVAAALLRAGVTPGRRSRCSARSACRRRRWRFFPRGHVLSGTVVVTLFVLTDMLDGAMARPLGPPQPASAPGSTAPATGSPTPPIFSGLVLWFTGDGDDRLLAGVALFCLVAGSLVSYAKARAEGLGPDAATSASPSAPSG